MIGSPPLIWVRKWVIPWRSRRSTKRPAASTGVATSVIAAVATMDHANRERFFRGREDIPLNANGIAQAELGNLRVKLPVNIAPFTHPPRRQEMILQQGLQLAVGLLVLHLLLVPAPQLEPAHEVGTLVGEQLVFLIRRLCALHRAVTRILHRQRAGDDQHLFDAALLLRRQQHAGDARVERQPGELGADLGELSLFVERVQFRQQLVAVGDEPRTGRIDEGKPHHIAEAQRLHAQDDAGERRAQQLGIGESWPVGEIGLVVQADADAVGDPAKLGKIEVGQRARDAGLTAQDAAGLLYDRDTVAFYGDPATAASKALGS